jgi:hypothetical protein
VTSPSTCCLGQKRDSDNVCGGAGGTRNDFLARNGFKTHEGSNLIGFELVPIMLALDEQFEAGSVRHNRAVLVGQVVM